MDVEGSITAFAGLRGRSWRGIPLFYRRRDLSFMIERGGLQERTWRASGQNSEDVKTERGWL
ncbi:unnamed protein product, partial [Nesidiocoris tenuis]